MSFGAPGRLWLLAVAVAVLLAYLGLQVVRPRIVARFADRSMLASVLPDRVGWQRHVAMGLLIATLAVLALGVARPQTVTRIPRRSAVVMLAIDTSASMASKDVAPTRLQAAQREAVAFATTLPATIRVGLVTFGTVPNLLVSPGTDRSALRAAINALTPAHATATAAALDVALSAIDGVRKDTHNGRIPGTIILLSDGSPSVGYHGQSPVAAVQTEAAAARKAGVPIDTIAYGTTAGAATMAQIANASGGRTFTARTADQLRSAYRDIGLTVGYRKVVHDLTSWFTGAALALALLVGAAGLVWMQRLL